MTLRPDQIGDRGQRYEVRYRDEDTPKGRHQTVGWSNDLPGAEQMANAWRLRPGTGLVVWIADRQWVGLENQP